MFWPISSATAACRSCSAAAASCARAVRSAASAARSLALCIRSLSFSSTFRVLPRSGPSRLARAAQERHTVRVEAARVSLTQSAIDEIKGMIIRGELRPGDRLPKESELAARLGLSRGSLREAVRGLTLIRVLEVRQGDGTYVTSLQPELLLESLSFFVDLNQDATLPQILEARRMLEAGAAAQAAYRASDEQLEELEHLVEEMGACETIEA